MKLIYIFDEEKVFRGSKSVDDDYVLSSNETAVAPSDGLQPPYSWNGIKWTGTVTAPQLTSDQQQIAILQQILMAQAADVAKLKQGVDKL